MTRKGRRLALISFAVAVIGAAVGLTLYALRGDVSLFVTPSQLASEDPPVGSQLRIGGLVAKGSVVRQPGGHVSFNVTDLKKTVRVTYVGILPDLFREGQGIVVDGVLVSPTRMKASVVLAKHDERYMPANVAEELKKNGMGKGGADASGPVARSGE